jgi:uncharacterized protein (TIGR00255 family)
MPEIRSMTGFGRAEDVTDYYRILVELKSVNHRYLDLTIKMPRRFNCFEARLRQLLKEYIERGKTDVYITFEDYSEGSRRLIYNRELASEYLERLKEMEQEFGIRNDVSTTMLARFPDVLVMEEGSDDEDRMWELLEPVVRKAAKAFTDDRAREGANLRTDLLLKLSQIRQNVADIVAFSPSVVEEYRNRLYTRIKETLADNSLTADEGRVVTEVTIFADKVCTDEEMVRLQSHVDAMTKKLETGGSCGRELDFIAQEMNREANTILSKSTDLKISDRGIALKTDIEKVREQIQNIE